MQCKDTANSRFADSCKAAAHCLSKMIRQGKSQTSPVDLGSCRLWTAVKRFEDLFQFRTFDAHTVILYADGHFLSVMVRWSQGGGQANAAISAAVFGGICNQIFEAAADRKQITRHARKSRFYTLLNNT